MFVKVRSLIYAAEFIIKFTAGEEQYFYCLSEGSIIAIDRRQRRNGYRQTAGLAAAACARRAACSDRKVCKSHRRAARRSSRSAHTPPVGTSH